MSFVNESGGSVAVNPTSVCVRVNGVPVAHRTLGSKSAPTGVMIGAVAGPRAEVSVRYCTERETCTDGCKVPKDEFLSAIGGAGGEDEAPLPKRRKRDRRIAAAGWSENDSGFNAANAAVEKEMAALDRDTQGRAGGMSVFKDWIQQSQIEGCSGRK